MITHQGVDRLARNAAGRLHVLISHDAPADPTSPIGRTWMPPSVQTEADTAQLLVQDAVDATNPAPGCSTGTATNQTDAASTTAPKSSDWQPTDTPQSAAMPHVSDLQADYINPLQRPVTRHDTH